MHQWLAEGAAEVLWSGGAGAAQSGVDDRFASRSSLVAEQWSVLATDQATGNVGGMMMAAVILLLLGLAGVVVWRTGFRSALPIGDSASADATARAESSVEASTSPETAPPPAADAGAGAAVEAGADAKSDPEIIVDILEDHGGRMKQANIVTETGWSKSKVSMLLSDMEEDGEISKLRVGRENIISLSGNEPEAAGSPFDDE